MNKKLVMRVDDRLIHGQVIEGWVKHFKIKHVFLVSNRVAGDKLQQMIYASILPSGCSLDVLSQEMLPDAMSGVNKKQMVLFLFESVTDLFLAKKLLHKDMYLNVGCVASREHKIEVSDTVFLDIDEVEMLCELRDSYDIHIKKLPWETGVEIKNFTDLLEG